MERAEVRDTRSFCKGYSSAGLMIARMGVSIMTPGATETASLHGDGASGLSLRQDVGKVESIQAGRDACRFSITRRVLSSTKDTGAGPDSADLPHGEPEGLRNLLSRACARRQGP